MVHLLHRLYGVDAAAPDDNPRKIGTVFWGSATPQSTAGRGSTAPKMLETQHVSDVNKNWTHKGRTSFQGQRQRRRRTKDSNYSL